MSKSPWAKGNFIFKSKNKDADYFKQLGKSKVEFTRQDELDKDQNHQRSDPTEFEIQVSEVLLANDVYFVFKKAFKWLPDRYEIVDFFIPIPNEPVSIDKTGKKAGLLAKKSGSKRGIVINCSDKVNSKDLIRDIRIIKIVSNSIKDINNLIVNIVTNRY